MVICYNCIPLLNIYLIKNTPGVKKGRPRTKQALLKKMWNQMGGQCLLVFIGLKVLVMMNSLHNIVVSGAQGLLMLMGSKFLIKMTRPQNIMIKNSVLRPGYLYQKFWSHQHQEALSTWNNNVMQWVHHDQNFQAYQNQEALAAHLISHLFQQGLFSSWPPLFLHLGCFWLDFTSFLIPQGKS